MRTISLLALSILLALEQSAAQTNRQALMLGHAVDEYLSEVYTAKSRTGFVFFSGEPIAFRVSIGNISSSRPTLVVGSTDPQQLFQVERFFASASSREASPGSRFKYADEREVNVPILFSTPKKIWAGGSFDLRLERDTPLDPGETIEWTLTVPSMNLEAGLYRFVIRMNATDSAQRPVDGFTSFAFEVRPASAEHQPEILRREVRRRFVLNDKDGARAAAVDLLRVHPNSYIAESLLAEIIDNATEAAVHRQNAQGILKSGRDALLVKYLSKEQIQQLLQPSGLVE